MTKLIEQAIEGHWGARCAEHQDGCPVCDAWREYDNLVMDNKVANEIAQKAFTEVNKDGKFVAPISLSRVVETTQEAWAPCALLMPMSDYELIDYLMACMAYDMREFASSPFTAGSISYLLGKYGEHFTPVGNKLYKHHLREKHSYAY